jgi:hypothetical protein
MQALPSARATRHPITPLVAKITTGSSERLLKAPANDKNSISASSDYTGFCAFFHELLVKPILNYFRKTDRYEEDRALKDNGALAAAMAVVDHESNEADAVTFHITNDSNQLEKHQIRNGLNENNESGVEHVQIFDDGTEKQIAFVVGRTVAQVKDDLNTAIQTAVKNVIQRVTDFSTPCSAHRIEYIRYATDFIAKHPEKFDEEFCKEVNEYQEILSKHPTLTSERFKQEVALHRIAAGDPKIASTQSAAFYLLDNTADSIDKTDSRLAAAHILDNEVDYSKERVHEALRHILRTSPSCSHLPANEAALHVIRSNAGYRIISIKAAAFLTLKQTPGCQAMSAVDAARHVINNASRYKEDAIKSAAYIVRHTPKAFVQSGDELICAKAIFNHKKGCSSEELMEAAKIIIQHTDGCKGLSIADAVRHIINHSSRSNEVSLQCAVYFLAHHLDAFSQPDDARVRAKAIMKYGMRCSDSEYAAAATTTLLKDCNGRLIEDLVRHIIKHPSGWPRASIKSAIYFFQHNPDLFNKPGNKLLRAKAIINHKTPCTDQEFITATRRIIRNTEGCKDQTIRDAAQSIISNQDMYPTESIISAAHYIFSHPGLYPENENIFQLAQTYIAEKYPEQHLSQAAKIVFYQNERFFTAPMEGQPQFIAAFNTAEEKKHLSNYSNGLEAILRSNNYYGDPNHTGQESAESALTAPKQNLSFYTIWVHFRNFDLVLEKSPLVAKYILAHWNHPAMKIWREFNSQNPTQLYPMEEIA